MGRNNKQTADYFPHYVGGKSRTKFILEKHWGNDGYAFWFKLLEILCASDGHYYDCWPVMNWEYLVATTSVDAETAESILATLARMEKIDRELWENYRVIWVESLMRSLQSLYTKRTTSPKRPDPALFSDRSTPLKETADNESAQAPVCDETVSMQPQDEPVKTPKTRKRKSTLSKEQERLFERFYEAYPKRVDRATAEKAWAQIEPTPDEAMTDAIIGAIEDSKKHDFRFKSQQFTPNPASWLNAKAYLNKYPSTGGEQHAESGGYSGFKPSDGFRGGSGADRDSTPPVHK